MIAFARNNAHDHTDLSTTDRLGGPYNASRRSIPSLYEQDSVDLNSVLISVAEPLVIQAAEAVRNAFNTQRKTACASLGYFNARGDIQYAKKADESNGTTLYTLEIVFGDSAVFAQVVLLPSNLNAKFQLISSIPGPCEDGVREQLAVSALGTFMKPPLQLQTHILLKNRRILTLPCCHSRQSNQLAEPVMGRFAQRRVRRSAHQAVRPRIEPNVKCRQASIPHRAYDTQYTFITDHKIRTGGCRRASSGGA